jgi:membrane-bound lytic murein transglycosylase B
MPPKDPGVRSWQAYRSRFVEPKRIAAGRRFMRVHVAELAAAEARFGVPVEIITAIIGVETIYGKHMGRFGTFAALTTLAFDYPPRADLFRRELEELLLLAREEQRNPLAYTGSYAGALGLPQFLPSSRRRYAIDFDGDGRIDLTNSPADAIGSVANFLARHGWEKDAPIAVTIAIRGDGVQALIDAGIAPRHTPQEMAAANVALTRVGAGETALPDQPAALIDLVTPDGMTEYRLGYRQLPCHHALQPQQLLRGSRDGSGRRIARLKVVPQSSAPGVSPSWAMRFRNWDSASICICRTRSRVKPRSLAMTSSVVTSLPPSP